MVRNLQVSIMDKTMIIEKWMKPYKLTHNSCFFAKLAEGIIDPVCRRTGSRFNFNISTKSVWGSNIKVVKLSYRTPYIWI